MDRYPNQTESNMPQSTFKTSICRFWQNGRCDKGNACPFAHGIADLRRPTCIHGFDCTKRLECSYVHRPAEIEYFRWKGKTTCDASTQTEPEPVHEVPPAYEPRLLTPSAFATPIIDPPPEFRDEPETPTDKKERKERCDKGKMLRCGLCKQMGHNRRTCAKRQ